MKLHKLCVLTVVMCSVGQNSSAAESGYHSDLYPTKLFLECRDGNYTNALTADTKDLFRRNATGSLPLHFALHDNNQGLEKLVGRYIEKSDNPYVFVSQDLWPHLLSFETSSLSLVTQSLVIAQKEKNKHFTITNEISDPVWNLIVAENNKGENIVYRTLKWNCIETLKRLMVAADGVDRSVWAIARNSTNSYYLVYKAFKKALKNHTWSPDEAKVCNEYMKLTREEMAQLICKYENMDTSLLEKELNEIFSGTQSK
jgi:hypothetical protein